MMLVTKFFKKHSKLVKVICLVLTSALVLGLAPADAFSGLVINTQAAYVPEYDPALGSYTQSGSILIATPSEGCGFRGWYDKSGTEVSYKKSFEMPEGTSIDDYTPVFYDFNLIKNGGFEGCSVGVDLKKDVYDDNIWYGVTSDENDWTKAVVSDDKANSGDNSARFDSRNNTIYRNITGLEVNTQYKLSFYYNFNSQEESSLPYLKYAVILPKDAELNAENNHLSKNFAVKYFENANTGGCADGKWKLVTLSFFTHDTTDFKIALTYFADADDTYLYIDDLLLIKDELGDPSYANDDFSIPSVANWTVPTGYFDIEHSDGMLKTKDPTKGNGGSLLSEPFFLKKGCDYTVTFRLDLSGVTDEYTQKFENGEYVTDESGNPVYETDENEVNRPNSFGFRITKDGTKDGILTVEKGRITVNDTISTTIDRNLGTTFTSSSLVFTKTLAVKEYDNGETGDDSNLTCTMTFTAPESTTVFFTTVLTGRGVYGIDDFKVEESQDDGIKAVFAEDTLKTIGTAIRTSGSQGIRHKTEIDKRLLCDEGYFGIRVKEYGTVATKNDLLNGADLTVDNGVVGAAYKLAVNKDVRYEDTKNGIVFTGVLINISADYWNTDFTMRGYMIYEDENGEDKVLYSDPVDSSIYLVSKFAYSAKKPTGEFVESDEIRKDLYTRILSKYKDKNITIDDETPIYNNFQGISSTVYHCFTFMEDEHGRTYTEEQAAIEMNRLKDSGIDNVRTFFNSQFAWEGTLENGGWNWDSDKMKAVYKWAKMLQNRGITITINASWHLSDFMRYIDYTYLDENENERVDDINERIGSSDFEVDYLKHVEVPSKYGEAGYLTQDKIDDGVTKEEFYPIVSARYGEWIAQALMAFKSHGVNNVKYLLPFTETGYVADGDKGEYPYGRKEDGTEENPEYSYWEWVEMTKGLHTALKKYGIREDYKIIGPSQSIDKDQNRAKSLMEFYTNAVKGTDFEGMVDILSSHNYPKPDTTATYEQTIYNPYSCYSWADKNFEYYLTDLRPKSEKNGDDLKEFWADEYFTNVKGVNRRDDVAFEMTQFAACLTKGINTGINRFLSWQLFDTLWLNHINTSSDSWIGGVHACGTAPSMIDTSDCPNGDDCPCHDYDKYVSKTPRKLYYGLNLLGKHLHNKNATVVSSSVKDLNDYDPNGGLYVSSIINDENRLVILVANTTNRPTNFNLNIESGFEAKFTRYTYNPEAITPTKEATSIPSDGYITSTEGKFYDTLAPGSFAFYISEIRGLGQDVEFDMGILSLPN